MNVHLYHLYLIYQNYFLPHKIISHKNNKNKEKDEYEYERSYSESDVEITVLVILKLQKNLKKGNEEISLYFSIISYIIEKRNPVLIFNSGFFNKNKR